MNIIIYFSSQCLNPHSDYLPYIVTNIKMKLFVQFVNQYGKMFHLIVQNVSLPTKVCFSILSKIFHAHLDYMCPCVIFNCKNDKLIYVVYCNVCQNNLCCDILNIIHAGVCFDCTGNFYCCINCSAIVKEKSCSAKLF